MSRKIVTRSELKKKRKLRRKKQKQKKKMARLDSAIKTVSDINNVVVGDNNNQQQQQNGVKESRNSNTNVCYF